jgi:hypothetical protein
LRRSELFFDKGGRIRFAGSFHGSNRETSSLRRALIPESVDLNIEWNLFLADRNDSEGVHNDIPSAKFNRSEGDELMATGWGIRSPVLGMIKGLD